MKASESGWRANSFRRLHPGAKAGGAGHIGRCRQHAFGKRGFALGEIVQDLAEGHLRRDLALRLEGDMRHLQPTVAVAARVPGEEADGGEELLERLDIRHTGERLPFLAGRDTHVRLPFGELGRRHQAAVIVLVAGDRRAPTLDRIGKEAGGPVVVDCGEGLGHSLDAVAAEIFHQRRELGIASALYEGRNVALVAEIVTQALAPDRAAHEGERQPKASKIFSTRSNSPSRTMPSSDWRL